MELTSSADGVTLICWHTPTTALRTIWAAVIAITRSVSPSILMVHADVRRVVGYAAARETRELAAYEHQRWGAAMEPHQGTSPPTLASERFKLRMTRGRSNSVPFQIMVPSWSTNRCQPLLNTLLRVTRVAYFQSVTC